jgi:glycine cleavage system H lipoate-binding protein
MLLVKGTILKVNTLEDLPYSSKKSTLSLVHYINKDPENLGWILLLKPASILKPIPNEILNFKEYNKLCHSLIQ